MWYDLAMQKNNLYLIQDADRPMWVVAASYAEALSRWTQLVAHENEQSPEEVEPCQGIQFVCNSNELLL